MKKIPLNHGRFALVDDEDFAYLSGFKWCAVKRSKTYYAWTGGNTYMHRLLQKPPKGLIVDHLNGDGLDNRRENLRSCTHSENHLNLKHRQKNNKSGHTGVWWDKSNKKWCAQIKANSKRYHLGLHTTIESAIHAREQFLKTI